MLPILILAALAGDLEFRHVATYGSKNGIHPPKVLNRRAPKAAVGESEHPYGLGYPTAVVTDSKDRIWIADSGTSSIHVFDPQTGGYREIRRVGDTTLSQPSGLAIDRQGYIYVTDTAAGAVYAFDPSGEFDRSLIPRKSGKILEGPTNIAASEDGRILFVADPPRKTILALNREGESIGTIGPIEPISIAVAGNELLALDGPTRQVNVFSFSGLFRRKLEWDEVRLPSAIAYDRPRGFFFVSNPRWMVVDVFASEGKNLTAFGRYGDAVEQMKSVTALWVAPNGTVFVIDSQGGKILVFASCPAER
jgi:DNA-binding beta-propeller fold protein YncE